MESVAYASAYEGWLAWARTALPDASSARCGAAAHAATIVGLLGPAQATDGVAAARAAAALAEGTAQEIAAIKATSDSDPVLRRLLAFGWQHPGLSIAVAGIQPAERVLAQATVLTAYNGPLDREERVVFPDVPRWKSALAGNTKLWNRSESALVTVTDRRVVCVTSPNTLKGILHPFRHGAALTSSQVEFPLRQITSLSLVGGTGWGNERSGTGLEASWIQFTRASVATPWRMQPPFPGLWGELLAHLSGVQLSSRVEGRAPGAAPGR
jgi:tellurite resistance protein